jgi:hypothetical protein
MYVKYAAAYERQTKSTMCLFIIHIERTLFRNIPSEHYNISKVQTSLNNAVTI